jgi:tetratricopeptide (TPR) repeat protein
VTRYAVTAAYWLHFDLDTEEEVVGHLKRNLDDLAQHFHARFQQAEDEEERDQDFVRSERWYRQYLGSFGDAPETPALHDRFADLLFEYGRFVESAEQYERVAYDYPPHEQSASAGYAAVFARREALSRSAETEAAAARSGVIESSLRFAEAFPAHEHAAPVLAAAVEDLYVLGDYARTIEVGRGMLAAYPAASPDVLQSAWLTVAHASFDSERYGEAEEAYGRALALSEDESGRAEIADNLAAAVYKQGEFAKSQGDARAAADHFLRVSAVAPSSAIGAVAEYDAAAALIEIEDWSTAAGVLEDFRDANPDHELQAEATRQVAFVYESAGDPGRAATEYERVAEEADTEDLRGEALLHAGELHEEAGNPQQAVTVYGLYVTEFTHPIDVSVATRFKMAQLHEQMGDEASRRAQLKAIVAIDARAGTERTPLVRSHAARSALFLAEPVYAQFADLRLTLPFERSLRRKREQMAKVLSSFEALVDYGVGEVTAGATYYIAETYDDFSRSLRESERPSDLSEAELMDYEDVLEEEAFPFEERAISVHEKNLELISAGVWSEWIEKSLGRLAERSPGRFARREQSAGPLRSIDHYVYRSPRAEADAELQVAVDEQPTGDDGSIGTEPSTPSSVPEKSEAVQPLSPPAAPAPGAAAGGDGAEPSFEGVR